MQKLGANTIVQAHAARNFLHIGANPFAEIGDFVDKSDLCSSLLPQRTSNTASFQAFLQVRARRFARQHILLVVDGAPNHRCSDLSVPGNITLLHPPFHSPELNQTENLWDEIREKIFKKMRSNPWTPCAQSSNTPSSTSNEMPSLARRARRTHSPRQSTTCRDLAFGHAAGTQHQHVAYLAGQRLPMPAPRCWPARSRKSSRRWTRAYRARTAEAGDREIPLG
jgi:hypothetical protein